MTNITKVFTDTLSINGFKKMKSDPVEGRISLALGVRLIDKDWMYSLSNIIMSKGDDRIYRYDRTLLQYEAASRQNGHFVFLFTIKNDMINFYNNDISYSEFCQVFKEDIRDSKIESIISENID